MNKYNLLAQAQRPALAVLFIFGLMGCNTTRDLDVDSSRFPVPVMQKIPLKLSILLDDDLTSYVHNESIENQGTYNVAVGPAQKDMFTNLADGLFESYEISNTLQDTELDGIFQPTIKEVQFSIPKQTRSDYFEVWIRYQMKLYDNVGNPIGEWNLPAYGKANKNDFRSQTNGLQEAALAACRDAMAFTSLNFQSEPVVQKWLAAGKPSLAQRLPSKPAASQENKNNTSAQPNANQGIGDLSSELNNSEDADPQQAESDDSETDGEINSE